MYSCFYDLASAFDSVEYPVLLSHLKSAGVTGKAWRLIKQWYTNPTSSVRVCGSVSSQFHIQRGVRLAIASRIYLYARPLNPLTSLFDVKGFKGRAYNTCLGMDEARVRQGSVLSPVLFLLVMDPILLELQSRSNGLNINGLFLGALSHADDICTLSTNLTDCRAQISSVSSFATQRGLMLSTEKCEAIISPSVPATTSRIFRLMLSRFQYPTLPDVWAPGGLPTSLAPNGLLSTSTRPEELFSPEAVGLSTAPLIHSHPEASSVVYYQPCCMVRNHGF